MNPMLAIGTYEYLLIFAIIALLFGARKLPELGRSLGEGIREFRKTSRELTEGDEKTTGKAQEKQSSDTSESDSS